MCGKRCQNIFYWVKKKDLFWVVFKIEKNVTINNATGLEGREEVIEIVKSTSCFSIYAIALALFAICIFDLPSIVGCGYELGK